ncbi:hypothetical protein ACH47C_23815 [Streptomyces rishiriensis]|uniref:hypothetical protein n=1 Tax=Streptomyces rishiriensis TaxID=68264 RepID=UPI00340EAF17
MIVFEVPAGELVDELNRQVAEAGITDAAIVSLIGAADSFTVSTMPEGARSRTPSPSTTCPAR